MAPRAVSKSALMRTGRAGPCHSTFEGDGAGLREQARQRATTGSYRHAELARYAILLRNSRGAPRPTKTPRQMPTPTPTSSVRKHEGRLPPLPTVTTHRPPASQSRARARARAQARAYAQTHAHTQACAPACAPSTASRPRAHTRRRIAYIQHANMQSASRLTYNGAQRVHRARAAGGGRRRGAHQALRHWGMRNRLADVEGVLERDALGVAEVARDFARVVEVHAGLDQTVLQARLQQAAVGVEPDVLEDFEPDVLPPNPSSPARVTPTSL